MTHPHTPRTGFTPRTPIILAAILLLTMLPIAAPPATAQTIIWCVKPGGGPTAPPCGNSEAFESLYNALEIAGANDQIRLASGVYTGGGRAVFDLSRPSWISGGYAGGNWQTPSDSQPTIIDGQGQRRGIYLQSVNALLENLIIQNGLGPIGSGDGGGIYLDGRQPVPGPLYLVNVTLRNNLANGAGGGVFAGAIESINTSFINNRATSNGGGFYVGSAALTGGVIEGNVAEKDGGGGQSNIGTFSMTGVLVRNNEAKGDDGGGVSIYNEGSITGSTFIGNKANGFGGGIYQSTFDGAVTISDSVFEENRAQIRPNLDYDLNNSGGAVFTFGGVSIERSRFERNFARHNGGAVFQNNPGKRLVIRDVLFAENTAEAGFGGGMAFGGGGLFERVEAIENSAGTAGGGLHQNTPDSGRVYNPITMRQSRIIGNEALSDQGGGMVIAEPLTLSDSEIRSNRAAGSGGGIYRNVPPYLFPPASYIGNTVIVDNQSTSGEGGGARLIGTVAITNCQILANRSVGNGGGISISESERTTIIGTIFGNNQSSGNGDALNSTGEILITLQLLNVTIAANTQQVGAAIRVEAPYPTIQLVNTLVTSHTIGIERTATSTLSGDYNAFLGLGAEQQVGGATTTFPFTNTLRVDPRFVNPPIGDFHLRPDSPLVDQGDPGRSYTSQRDIDQQHLPAGPRADIGADELIVYTEWIFLPVIQLRGNY